MRISKATLHGFQIIMESIEERRLNTGKIELLQQRNATLAGKAMDAARATGYTPNANSKTDKQTNTEVIARYREIYGQGFTCYGSHGRGKIDLSSCSSFQIKVVNWFSLVPRLEGKSFQVASATK